MLTGIAESYSVGEAVHQWIPREWKTTHMRDTKGSMGNSSGARGEGPIATLLLTDVENSTQLWEENKVGMRSASARHDEIIEALIRSHGGQTSKSQWEGDSVVGVFPTALGAAECALQLQLQMIHEPWPDGLEIRLRQAVYTGEAFVDQGMVSGSVVTRATALRNMAHGGQILVSQATAGLLREALPSGASLLPLGSYPLGETKPEIIHELSSAALRSDFPPLEGPAQRGHGMPHQLTTFIGRETELDELGGLLERTRIITLTGAGGLGKTRLALELANMVADRFRDGVFVVELGAVSDPLRVTEAISAIVGAKERPPLDLVAVLTADLASKSALLVLDNCEHLVGSVAHVVDAILRGAPGVRILATSRQPLSVDGETLWRIPPLKVPPASANTPDALELYESTELFLKRARERDLSFLPTQTNAVAIAEICRRLDGIPLAVELAASRVKVLSPEQIANRLGGLFGVLIGSTRTALPRQRTLEATIDWSYQLLESDERKLFRDLSVFKGGFTIESAESVCASDEETGREVLDLLSALVDKSLVLSENLEGMARFRMLEVLRQFAFQRLSEEGVHDVLAERHIKYLAALAQRARGEITGQRQTYWSSLLAAEDENIAACLEWSNETGRGSRAALSIVANLGWFWHLRGTWATAYSTIGKTLDAAPSDATPERTKALIGAAVIGHSLGDPESVDHGIAAEAMAMRIGDKRLESQALKVIGDIAAARADYQEAQRLHEAALNIRREIGEASSIAESLHSLADVLRLQGKYEDSRRLSQEALEEMRGLRDERGIAKVLAGLGHLEERQGNYSKARSLHQEALDIRRRIGDVHGVASALYSLANVAWAQGDQEAAQEMFSTAADQMERLGDRYGMALAISGLGHIAAATNDHDAAVELYGRSLKIRREIGDRHGVGGSLHSMGNLALAQGDLDKARQLFEEALSIARTLGSTQGLAATLNSLGNVAGVQEDYASAVRYYSESLEIKRDLGEKHGIAISLANMGLVCLGQVQIDEAYGYFTEAHSICSELGMKSGISTSLHGLASVDRARGLFSDSIDKLRESLVICEELQDKDALADVLDSLGGALIESGSPEIGAKAFGLAGALRKAIGASRSPVHDRVFNQDLSTLYAALSKDRTESLMSQGASGRLEDLLAEVSGSGG